MKKDDLELVRGSGNVYRDFGRPNAGLEQARAATAAKIIRIIDERKLLDAGRGKADRCLLFGIFPHSQYPARPVHARPNDRDSRQARRRYRGVRHLQGTQAESVCPVPRAVSSKVVRGIGAQREIRRARKA